MESSDSMRETDKGPALAAAPAPFSQSSPYKECTYLCFYSEPNYFGEDGFKINSKFSILSFKKHKKENLIVLCVYCEGLLNRAAKWFTSKFSFQLIYEYKNSITYKYPTDFTVEKDTIKFIFNAGNDISIKGNHFKNPSCLEQYNAFHFISKNHEKLFEDAKNYLSWNFDIELFLTLIKDNKDKREELMNVFKKIHLN